jgi:hypothetical protein
LFAVIHKICDLELKNPEKKIGVNKNIELDSLMCDTLRKIEIKLHEITSRSVVVHVVNLQNILQ